MNVEFYKPATAIVGPAYSGMSKVMAALVTIVLVGYGVNIALRLPLLQYGFGVDALLLCAALMLAVSYSWFLRSTVTIDDQGITQTWMYNRRASSPARALPAPRSTADRKAC